MNFQFNKNYGLLTLLLLTIEILIALFVHDKIIRPYLGDVLVVILIYTAIKTFFNYSVLNTAMLVFIFATLIEFLQLFHLVNRLGIENNAIAKIVLGSTFELTDILMYAAGLTIVIFVEKSKKQNNAVQ